ncbi:hypothetical protein PHMEG_00031973 [Phytophthora megakarya]|uniref:Uncharacterized protein n=1 Tax=Phytophthora megakarya TaxID=4795 RepID=A0A225UX16_9STRA|nr:hypothetical protein PHMEG_00031973 [Phytophthora megakarya]
MCKTAADEATSYQNALARTNARISSLNSQLAAASVPALPLASPSVSTTASQTSVTGDELSRVRADLSSAQASVPSEQSRVRSVTSKRDSARAESELRRVRCDATAAELNDARDSLDRSRRELDVAQHQRDVARIRDLGTSSSVAEAARVSAQADRDSAQACVLPIASRTAIFRSALVSARRSATQRRVQTQVLVRRLSYRAAGLENALALSQQASQAEVARLEARAGRESARLVRDALVTRLSDMVTAVGGSLDVTQLVRDSESRVEASTYVATPLSPDLDPEIGRTAATLSGLPASTASRSNTASTADDPAASTVDASASTTPASSVVPATSPPPTASPASSSGPGGPTLSSRGGRGAQRLRRSRRSSTIADTTGGGRFFSSDSDSDDGTHNGGPAGSPPDGGVAPAVRPFFTPVIPPFQHRVEWTRSRYTPWPRALRDLTLSSLTARALRVEHLPPRAWIFTTTSSPVPAFWDPTLLTERMVEGFYATHPHFQPFIGRYDVHLDHWTHAYWESTHEFPVPNTPARTRWRRRRNSRRSHAGDHLVGTFQLLLILLQAGRVDMDVLLDVMVLLFSPGRSCVGRWYPDLRNSTLEAALADIDAREPWRRFFRTQSDAAGNTTVEREHQAYNVRSLASKFVERGQSQP